MTLPCPAADAVARAPCPSRAERLFPPHRSFANQAHLTHSPARIQLRTAWTEFTGRIAAPMISGVVAWKLEAKDGARFARRAGYPRPFGTPDQQRQPLVGEQRGEGLNGGRLRFSNDDAFDLVAPQAAVRLDEAWVRGRSMADPIAAHTVTGVRQNRTACAREAKALPAVLHPWSGSTRTRRGAAGAARAA